MWSEYLIWRNYKMAKSLFEFSNFISIYNTLQDFNKILQTP